MSDFFSNWVVLKRTDYISDRFKRIVRLCPGIPDGYHQNIVPFEYLLLCFFGCSFFRSWFLDNFTLFRDGLFLSCSFLWCRCLFWCYSLFCCRFSLLFNWFFRCEIEKMNWKYDYELRNMAFNLVTLLIGLGSKLRELS